MNIIVLGSDGYIGYPLTWQLLEDGHTVLGLDNYSRRDRVHELGSNSLTPISTAQERNRFFINAYSNFAGQVNFTLGLNSVIHLKHLIEGFKPDAIIHLAEQPSAAWSMKDIVCATKTQYENVVGTLHLLWVMKECCPDAHLIKLGTMGEYGTPDCDIPEGRIPYECTTYDDKSECHMGGLLFPRTAGSIYHLSKVHDTHNIEFACRNWRLRSTDIMQGVVYGLLPEMDCPMTRFDYDECFGTVINRFCVQAISNTPLTVYGTGNQTRGFIHLVDSIKCIVIALNNPPKKGEYRTFNQFDQQFQIKYLAHTVCEEAEGLGIGNTSIEHLHNPRVESEDHYYKPIHQKLFDLGYIPYSTLSNNIRGLLSQLIQYKDRVNYKVIQPNIRWRQSNDTD
jgi:UDP-sulfoquinovose synthase